MNLQNAADMLQMAKKQLKTIVVPEPAPILKRQIDAIFDGLWEAHIISGYGFLEKEDMRKMFYALSQDDLIKVYRAVHHAQEFYDPDL